MASRGVHDNGYRWGPANMAGALSRPRVEPELPRHIEGTSFAPTGDELLAGDGAFVAWFDCVLDAIDALKVHVGAGKVVRCSDRALLKLRRRG